MKKSKEYEDNILDLYTDDIIHDLESLDFNSSEARKVVRRTLLHVINFAKDGELEECNCGNIKVNSKCTAEVIDLDLLRLDRIDECILDLALAVQEHYQPPFNFKHIYQDITKKLFPITKNK